MPARIRRAMQVAGWCSGALRHGWTVCVVLIAGARESELEVGQGGYEDLLWMACRIAVCGGMWSVVASLAAGSYSRCDEDASQANFAAAYRGASDRRRVMHNPCTRLTGA
jgi:hypothetical protein